MFRKLSCMFSAACAISVAHAAPSNLSVPALYDNVGLGLIWGQTFVAETAAISGVRWYIGDPTRPGLDSVDGLEGKADLVLFSADDLGAPIEIGRTQIQGADGLTSGLTDFQFASSINTLVGKSYFIGIDTSDAFGIGLTPSSLSTYAGGAEARLQSGKLTLMSGGRDTSFEIVAAPVPEPTTIVLALVGLGVVACSKREKA